MLLISAADNTHHPVQLPQTWWHWKEILEIFDNRCDYEYESNSSVLSPTIYRHGVEVSLCWSATML